MDSFISNAPDARLASDLSLLAYILLVVPAMLVGFVFARRKMFRPYHKYTMTAITIFNWVIILFLMVVSYGKWVAPSELGGPFGGDRAHIIPTLHMITGGVAQLLATYLVILMWTERTRFKWVVPKFLQIQNIKPFMRATLALWLLTALMGVGIFLTWYPPGPATAAPEPVETPEVSATEEVMPVATVEVDTIATQEVEPVETEEVDDNSSGMGSSDDDAAPVETEEAEG